MKIQILGTGCPKCNQLMENAKVAAREMGVQCEFEKITKMNDMLKFGVMITPALAIDGKVKSCGKILSPDEIKKMLA